MVFFTSFHVSEWLRSSTSLLTKVPAAEFGTGALMASPVNCLRAFVVIETACESELCELVQ